jgi:hypothetical protein
LMQMAMQSSPTWIEPMKISSLQRFVSIKVSAWFKWQDKFWASMWFVILRFVEDCLGKWMEHCRRAAVRTCQCLFYYNMLRVYLLKNVWQLILVVFIKSLASYTTRLCQLVYGKTRPLVLSRQSSISTKTSDH